MPGLGKRFNEYAGQLPAGWYDSIPKAVWAAIAVSKCTGGQPILQNATLEGR